MTIAEKLEPANNSNQSRAWGQPGPKSCHYLRTYYQNGRVQQQWVPCKQLDCPSCGPEKRQADLDRAVKQFSEESVVYVIQVPSWQVDHLRKQAGRRDHPIKSLPVSEDHNAVFSTYAFDGSHVPDEEELRRLFLYTRISKRRLTDTGKWARRTVKSVVPEANRCITLSKTYVGREAFNNIAKRLGATVTECQDTVYFVDHDNRGPEWFKKALVEEEHRIRKARLKARGWGWARRFQLSAA